MASALQKYLRSEYSHSVHGGVSSLLAVVSSPAHQHAPKECTAVPGPSLWTIPHTTGPSSTVHCRPPWQCSAAGGWEGNSRLGKKRKWDDPTLLHVGWRPTAVGGGRSLAARRDLFLGVEFPQLGGGGDHRRYPPQLSNAQPETVSRSAAAFKPLQRNVRTPVEIPSDGD